MKSPFKVTSLAITVAVVLHAPTTFATEVAKPAITADSKAVFRNDDQKSAYAPSASLGRYTENSLREQEKLGIEPDKDQSIAGIQNAFTDKSKLSDQEIKQTPQTSEVHMKSSVQAKMEKDAVDDETRGKEYRERFVKGKGMKTSFTGLVYQAVEVSKGGTPRDSDTVVVDYKDVLTNGREFDSSYTRSEPFSFRPDGVISGQTEGLGSIKKDGKIKLVTPSELTYDKADVLGTPPNSTLVFDVELLDVKPVPKADIRPGADVKAADSARK